MPTWNATNGRPNDDTQLQIKGEALAHLILNASSVFHVFATEIGESILSPFQIFGSETEAAALYAALSHSFIRGYVDMNQASALNEHCNVAILNDFSSVISMTSTHLSSFHVTPL